MNKYQQIDSWKVYNSETAVKVCDKSFFKWLTTGIPREMTKIFGADEMNPGDVDYLIFVFSGRSYQVRLVKDIQGRVRLYWNHELGNKFAAEDFSGREKQFLFHHEGEKVYSVMKYVNSEQLIDAETFQLCQEEQEKQVLIQKPEDLLKRALERNGEETYYRQVKSNAYVRNPYVAAYSKMRARGICQLCGKPAPFKDNEGNPYLECHHIVWLSRGGKDSVDNTVALCPNCHRRMHVVDSLDDINILLKKAKEL